MFECVFYFNFSPRTFRLSVGIVFVLAKPDLQIVDQILGPGRRGAGHPAAEVPVSEVHRRPFAAGAHVVCVHRGVAQLRLHGHQHH